MQGKAKPRSDHGGDPPSLESKDASVQGAVLALVLEAHPKLLTIPELAAEIDEGDAAERAVVALVGVGLLDCGGISVQPSRAALHFDWLGV